MTSRTLRFVRLGFGAVAASMLVACGGDDDGDTSTTAVPASAGESSASFFSYLRGLATSDTEEPLRLDDFAAPVDDSSDGTPLT